MSLLVLAALAGPLPVALDVPDWGVPSYDPTTFRRVAQPVAGLSTGIGCTPLTNGGFQGTLLGWDVSASDAAAPGTAVAALGACELRENGSFLTTVSQGICVPPNATALVFDLVSTDFDESTGFFPDAFEVSLLDGTFQSVVPTWSASATSFFNVQEDGTFLSAADVEHGPAAGVLARVRLDLTALAPVLAGFDDLTLYFDLIGADADVASLVVIDRVEFEDDLPGTVFCEGIACPCGNDSPGTGCLNSRGTGGLLSATGSASIAANDLTLEASGLPQNFAVVILALDETCAVLGDGLAAIQPGLYQTGILRGGVQLVDPAGVVTFGPGAIQSVESNLGMPGLITAGSTWHFQVAYRDEPTSPCGSRFNLTNGLRITFAD
ncbi:MAG: hypothetical protein AAFU73_15970 [Planctomycetota bacterium]